MYHPTLKTNSETELQEEDQMVMNIGRKSQEFPVPFLGWCDPHQVAQDAGSEDRCAGACWAGSSQSHVAQLWGCCRKHPAVINLAPSEQSLWLPGAAYQNCKAQQTVGCQAEPSSRQARLGRRRAGNTQGPRLLLLTCVASQGPVAC